MTISKEYSEGGIHSVDLFPFLPQLLEALHVLLLLLQIRTRVLHDDLAVAFREWYLRFQQDAA